jgi:hypothetical protein
MSHAANQGNSHLSGTERILYCAGVSILHFAITIVAEVVVVAPDHPSAIYARRNNKTVYSTTNLPAPAF